jgi:hypothetical protein
MVGNPDRRPPRVRAVRGGAARRGAARHPSRMQIVVDGSAGGEAAFAGAVAAGLRERGLDVELRPPKGGSMFDTAVHLVSSGLVVRVAERPDRETLETIEQVVRGALQRHPSLRRRTRTVPVHLGESARVLEWIDVFG